MCCKSPALEILSKAMLGDIRPGFEMVFVQCAESKAPCGECLFITSRHCVSDCVSTYSTASTRSYASRHVTRFFCQVLRSASLTEPFNTQVEAILPGLQRYSLPISLSFAPYHLFYQPSRSQTQKKACMILNFSSALSYSFSHCKKLNTEASVSLSRSCGRLNFRMMLFRPTLRVQALMQI